MSGGSAGGQRWRDTTPVSPSDTAFHPGEVPHPKGITTASAKENGPFRQSASVATKSDLNISLISGS